MAPVSELREMPLHWVGRGLALVIVLVLVASATSLTLAYDPPDLEPGSVDKSANGTTIVAVQGFHFKGQYDKKKPARLVGLGPDANVSWVYDGSKRGASWFYDTDPLPNGDLLAVNTMQVYGVGGQTVVYRLDPETKERVWEARLDLTDTHDVDLINGDQLLVANMRRWNATAGVSNDRLILYDISPILNGSRDQVTEEDIVWEWHFKDHYPAWTDEGMNDDWTHVNDVDKIGPGRYMVSVRNFDQVIVVDRSTDEIDRQLGADGNLGVLYEQHNPTYLETADGKPTILVADSENDRVVEYTCTETAGGDCEWELVWEVGKDQLNWPRDADRLPNGNTLIVDSMGHRVVEVTPSGRIVWEAYVPWSPYDVERMPYGDEGRAASNLPTMLDLNASGFYNLTGSAGLAPGTRGGKQTFPQWLETTFGRTPIGGPVVSFAELWESGAQWIKPVWMAPWAFVHLASAVLVTLFWAIGELVYHRRRLRHAVGRAVARLG